MINYQNRQLSTHDRQTLSVPGKVNAKLSPNAFGDFKDTK